MGAVRWESLFRDLEAQLSAAERADVDAEVAERSRAEWGQVALADRLRAGTGGQVELLLVGGERLSGTCADVAPEWVVVLQGRTQVLVPLHGLAAVVGPPRAVAPRGGEVLHRLRLGHALRALARDRAAVRLVTAGGTLTGTIDRVAADHLDLAEHLVGEPRRPGAVRDVVAVPFAALRSVHST